MWSEDGPNSWQGMHYGWGDIVGEALFLEIILSPELKIGKKAMLGHSFLFLASPAMTSLHHQKSLIEVVLNILQLCS